MAWTQAQRNAQSKRMKAAWKAKKAKSVVRTPAGDVSVPPSHLFRMDLRYNPYFEADQSVSTTNYTALRTILDAAYEQAAHGKGAERHAQDKPFDEQPMQIISDMLGTHSGMLYQAMKKIQESARMPRDRAVQELLGAIVYTAGAILFLQGRDRCAQNDDKQDIQK